MFTTIIPVNKRVHRAELQQTMMNIRIYMALQAHAADMEAAS
jgi:hypothetical protein